MFVKSRTAAIPYLLLICNQQKLWLWWKLLRNYYVAVQGLIFLCWVKFVHFLYTAVGCQNIWEVSQLVRSFNSDTLSILADSEHNSFCFICVQCSRLLKANCRFKCTCGVRDNASGTLFWSSVWQLLFMLTLLLLCFSLIWYLQEVTFICWCRA